MADTLIIHRSRWKLALAALVSLAFVAAGVWMIGDPDGSARYSAEIVHFIGWMSVILFGLAGMSNIIGLARPAQLVITSEGFAVRHWFRAKSVAWDSVAELFVLNVRHTRMVAWRLRDDAPERGAMSAVNRVMGCDGSVGGGWQLSPDEILAAMVNRNRRFARDELQPWRTSTSSPP